MARPKDSVEIATFKKESTKNFIELVRANSDAASKDLESMLKMGGDGGSNGIVLCAYGRGRRSMSFPTLLEKIELSVQRKILNRNQADKFLVELGDKYSRIETGQYENEKYVYDPLPSKLSEFKATVKSLVAQAHELEELSNSYATTLDLLKPVQELALDLSSRKGKTPRQKKAARNVEEGLLRLVEEKWGVTVPEAGVRKLFGAAHGVPITNGAASSISVAAKLTAARMEALTSVSQF